MARILVVDDEIAICRMIARVLRTEHEVAVQFSGAAALAQIRSGFHPDLILLDVRMPQMTGPQLLEHLQADPSLAAIRVVWLSATVDADADRAPRDGRPAIGKPFEMAELLQCVKAALSPQIA